MQFWKFGLFIILLSFIFLSFFQYTFSLILYLKHRGFAAPVYHWRIHTRTHSISIWTLPYIGGSISISRTQCYELWTSNLRILPFWHLVGDIGREVIYTPRLAPILLPFPPRQVFKRKPKKLHRLYQIPEQFFHLISLWKSVRHSTKRADRTSRCATIFRRRTSDFLQFAATRRWKTTPCTSRRHRRGKFTKSLRVFFA